jgi:hypothetical protein
LILTATVRQLALVHLPLKPLARHLSPGNCDRSIGVLLGKALVISLLSRPFVRNAVIILIFIGLQSLVPDQVIRIRRIFDIDPGLNEELPIFLNLLLMEPLYIFALVHLSAKSIL